MKCADCFYFDGDEFSYHADCYRMPPVVVVTGDATNMSEETVRPEVSGKERACGEFKPRDPEKS